jgi:hypothetical protein
MGNNGVRLLFGAQKSAHLNNGFKDGVQVSGVNGIDGYAQVFQLSDHRDGVSILYADTEIRFEGDDFFKVQVNIRAHLGQFFGRRGEITEPRDTFQEILFAQSKNDFRNAGGQGNNPFEFAGNGHLPAQFVRHRPGRRLLAVERKKAGKEKEDTQQG